MNINVKCYIHINLCVFLSSEITLFLPLDYILHSLPMRLKSSDLLCFPQELSCRSLLHFESLECGSVEKIDKEK
jgi:hypothetical protein